MRYVFMIIPTLDQTEGIWINRTPDQGYHYVQEVFHGKTAGERWHQENCRGLITRGSLLPEFRDGHIPSQRAWDATQRYTRVHT
jgi:hypothetical protein